MMNETRFRAFKLLSLSSMLVVGLAVTGCAGNTSVTTGTGGSGGSGGSAAGGGGSGGGTGGSGGSACVPETEICDMKDNDCDGQIDNVPGGCTCYEGDQQPCYTGPDGTSGIGACKDGAQNCENGTWGECMGQVVPADEECNLIDDDCNDLVDDMGMAMCGVGACAAQVEKCIDGQLQTCTPGQPSLEVCDGIDNNCNQLTDESDPTVGTACMTGTPGVCATGVMTCNAGVLACTPDAMAVTETCDGLDNDCDGTIDNNIPGTGGACSTGQAGVCAAGTISCALSAGTYTVDCFPDIAASPEICDGLDNDCNSMVDDGNPEGGGACDTGQLGICQAGTYNCVNGAVECTPDAQASMETCNGIDDNCDGQIDEGDPGGGQSCGCGGSGITSCQNGALTCNGGPITYFTDDFADSSKGWTLDTTWAIGPAQASTGCSFGNDPATDHTATADNGIAGVVLGGCYPTTTHPDYCMTSPNINTSTAAGSVFFSYWRHLHSDYPSYMTHTVSVSANGGSSWTTLYAVPSGQQQNDTAWTQASYDITAYKSATMKVRFCYAGTSGGIISGGGWNIDDVTIASAVCP